MTKQELNRSESLLITQVAWEPLLGFEVLIKIEVRAQEELMHYQWI